ncbi:MAG: hypothetical protein WBQ94_12265 [Terracidiphilus sp.]
MTNLENADKDDKAILNGIVGLMMLGSRSFCATRHFYFGSDTLQFGLNRSHYTLGLECPWRIRKSSLIMVGSDDYSEKAEGNDDPAWEPGMHSGHLQDQRLAELLGELREGSIVTTHSGFTVRRVELGACGDIQIELEPGWVLEVFPDGSKSMQWIFKSPDQPSIVLMNGVLNRTKRKKTIDDDGEPRDRERVLSLLIRTTAGT